MIYTAGLDCPSVAVLRSLEPSSSQSRRLDASTVPICHPRPEGFLMSPQLSAYLERLKKLESDASKMVVVAAAEVAAETTVLSEMNLPTPGTGKQAESKGILIRPSYV